MFQTESSLTKSSQLIGKGYTKTKFKPEKSLVYIIYCEQILIGGALLTDKYALTLAAFLKDFINDKRLLENLFLGIGVDTFNASDTDHHNNIIDIVEDGQDTIDDLRRLAVITVSNYTRISKINQLSRTYMDYFLPF